MIKTGRRNISILTCAPTGTVSLMTQTTSGIEPVFLPFYKRNRKLMNGEKNGNISFIDEMGDAWESYIVFHPKFLVWAEKAGENLDNVIKMDETELKKLYEKSPYFKASSADVD